MTGSDWTGLGLATSMAVAAALSAVLSTQFGLHIWRMQTQVGVVVVVVGTVIVGRKKPHIHE
jgi:FtsH-binding integral membrane protein